MVKKKVVKKKVVKKPAKKGFPFRLAFKKGKKAKKK